MRKPLLLLPLFVVVTLGCSEGAKDRLTRFFFEVPEGTSDDAANTEAASPDEATTAVAAPEPRYVSVHAPYRDKRCGGCHDTANRMRVFDDQAAACAACHQRYFTDAVEHEPVAGGDCDTCHLPHRSTFSYLLKGTVLESCADCHDPDDLGEEGHDVPSVENCTACHDPHFGSAPYLKSKES